MRQAARTPHGLISTTMKPQGFGFRFSRRLLTVGLGFCLLALGSLALFETGLVRLPEVFADTKTEDKTENKTETAPAKPIPLQSMGVLGAHPDWVTSVAVSPDGKTIAVGSYETITLWDVATKKQNAVLKTKTGFVQSIAYSPDGGTLASGSYQTVTLWDATSQSEKSLLSGHRGYVTGADFSPDGTLLATSSDDETVRVWDLESHKESLVLKGHRYPVNSVCFSPNGQLLATAAGDSTRSIKPGEVRLWNATTGEVHHAFPDHRKMATCVAFSPDGKTLASASQDETVQLWNVETGEARLTFAGHSRPVNTIDFTPDGTLIATGCGGRFVKGNEAKVWDPVTGVEKGIAAAFQGRVTSLKFSPDGKQLVTGSYDKNVTIWNTEPLLAAAEPATAAAVAVEEQKPKMLRAGIIGLDTSHVTAFTKILNDPEAKEDVSRCRVVAAYPKGSPDIESSVSRVPGYTEALQKMDVEIVDSIEALLEKVDVVFLETNDGRPHLEQALPVLKAGKPLFIDKPIAASLADAVAIFDAAKEYQVPVFSSSSLRFSEGAQALRNGKIGKIVGCDAYSPCSLEKTHPDLFWYGIHGVETLFTVMGAGCESVSRTSTPGVDLAVGTWKGGRVGTFRGIREGGSGYGGTAFGTDGVSPVGSYGGYRPLLVEIIKFFRTGTPPVSEEETLEIYAFMEAADASKAAGGTPVTIASMLEKARKEVADRKKAAADK